MKKLLTVLFVLIGPALGSNASAQLAQPAFSHNVDHGSLTLLSNDGFWRRWSTEFPIAGGWMSPGSPTDTGNGPNGSLWVFQQGDVWGGSWGVYDNPITLEQYNNPTLINRTWSWGIYYVEGENKVLEYGAFDYQYPPNTVSYSISYSAAVVPEPTSALLVFIGFASLFRASCVRPTSSFGDCGFIVGPPCAQRTSPSLV